VAAEKDPARHTFTQNCNRVTQTRAVAFRIARKRRAGSSLLTEGQIAAQNDVAMSGKSFADRHQQRSRTIRARAVRQDQRVAVWHMWSVQPTSYCGIERVLGKQDRRLHRIRASGFCIVAGENQSRSFASLRVCDFFVRRQKPSLKTKRLRARNGSESKKVTNSQDDKG
jgi:hypothetical protein